MERGKMWCVLRTAGRHTLALAESLAREGLETYAPSFEKHIRRPRWNVSRKVRRALMPEYVFVRACHRLELVALAAEDRTPRRPFQILGECEDAALEPLRLAELPKPVRRKFGRYAPGSEVRITDGAFEGFTAKVEKSGPDSVLVWVSLFGRHHRVKIKAFKLQPIRDISPSRAARKAA